MSLRARLLIATGISVVIGLIVIDAVTYGQFTRSQVAQVDASLERAHSPTEQLAASNDEANWSIIPEVAPGLYVAILDRAGRKLFVTPARSAGDDPVSLDLSLVDLSKQKQTVRGADGHDIRLRVDRTDGGRTVVVGESLHEVQETSSRLLVVLLGATAIAVAVVLGSAWWLIALGLKPLRAVEMSAAAITDDALGDRRVPGGDEATEVGRLATALNAMLDRLEDSRADRERTVEELRSSEARMRQFVADASHELRTPIAATGAYAELFEGGARDRPADLDRAMAGIRSETKRMSGLVDDLLLLARLDERVPLSVEQVDVTEIVLTAVDAARVLEPDRPFAVSVESVVEIEGDPVRLRQVVDNILSNVRAHTPSDVRCVVKLGPDVTGGAVLTISDEGPGVDAIHLSKLRDRFFRVDEARSRAKGGSGLGLAIATAVVEAHGGTLIAEPNQPHGLTISMRLPEKVEGDQSVAAIE